MVLFMKMEILVSQKMWVNFLLGWLEPEIETKRTMFLLNVYKCRSGAKVAMSTLHSEWMGTNQMQLIVAIYEEFQILLNLYFDRHFHCLGEKLLKF